MNKKSQLSLDIIIIATIVLIVLIVIWGIFTGKFENKFNPKEDVCDLWKVTNLEYRYSYELTPNEYGGIQPGAERMWEDKCIKWHKANKCELDANAEGCVCDEYEKTLFPRKCPIIDDTIVTFENHTFCQNNRGEITSVLYIVEGEICIKSHLPNECEKNNFDYFLEVHKEYKVPMNETYCQGLMWFDDGSQGCGEYKELIKISIPTGKQIETCRRKKISDFSCEELDKPWKLRWTITCELNGKLVKGCRNTIKNRISIEQLYDIMKEKGCEI